MWYTALLEVFPGIGNQVAKNVRYPTGRSRSETAIAPVRLFSTLREHVVHIAWSI